MSHPTSPKCSSPRTPQAEAHHLPVKKADPGDLTPEHPSTPSLVSPGPHGLSTFIVHPAFCTGFYIWNATPTTRIHMVPTHTPSPSSLNPSLHRTLTQESQTSGFFFHLSHLIFLLQGNQALGLDFQAEGPPYRPTAESILIGVHQPGSLKC